MSKYKKTIAALVAWVGVLATAGADLSLSQEEITTLVIGLVGVYAVYKARNATPEEEIVGGARGWKKPRKQGDVGGWKWDD